MTDDEIINVLRNLHCAPGVQRFAALLGFTAPLRRRVLPPHCTVPVRTIRTTRRGTLRLHTVRMRTAIGTSSLRALLRTWRMEEPAAHHVVLALEPRAHRIAIGCDPLHDGLRHVVFEPASLRHVEIQLTRDVIAAVQDDATATAIGIMRALDRRVLTSRFFRAVRSVRDLVSSRWTGIPVEASAERNALALLLLSRLLFLYFLQQRGLLCGDPDFLRSLFHAWQRQPAAGSFFRSTLRTVFFGVLNRKPERRTPRARSLGPLPYLNGGLFERHRLEISHPDLDLEDDAIASVFACLLERYRFTAADAAAEVARGAADGIDPELLGQIFEGLMPGDQRGSTGTFYTPVETVDRLVTDALSMHVSRCVNVDAGAVALRLAGEPSPLTDYQLRDTAQAAARIRVLDPACGSGAFLLSALSRLETLALHPGVRATDVREQLIAHSLHGVDIQDDAALICSLRLWLALVPRCGDPLAVAPLPNLDRCVRQGDALVDPLDTRTSSMTPVATPALRAIVRQIEPAHLEYTRSTPEQRRALRQRIRRLETSLAREWTAVMARRLHCEHREALALASERDLFGDVTAAAAAARHSVPALVREIRKLEEMRTDIARARALPFFSFPVHFPQCGNGFDVVLSNPPWVRTHSWPAATARLLRERYRVCTDAGWPWAAHVTRTPAGASAQVDLAFLFLERSISLLRENGTLGIVLPAKLLRSLAPGGARGLLLGSTEIACIDDHSLDQRAIFDADAFTATLVAHRSSQPAGTSAVRVRMTRSGAADLQFDVAARDLPLRNGDLRAPWLLAPPECARALRAMQRAGVSLSESGLCVRRGAMTSANQHMMVTNVRPRLGDIVEITTVSGARGFVEENCIRPVLRGTDVRAWSCTTSLHVLWSPRNDDPRAAVPRRFSSFVRRHLPRASDGRLQRISAGLFGNKVVWSDLARDLRATAAGCVRSYGREAPLIPLNTVYFVPTADHRTALILSALLNSLPLRTFARTIAERAKDAHFRFFAWTVAMVPLPPNWSVGPLADQLLEISTAAHSAGAITAGDSHRLDEVVAAAFGLSADDTLALRHFDRWLRGDA